MQRLTAHPLVSFVSQLGFNFIVGNIPYDASEQDLKDTLSLAGPFKEFRLKIDQKT